MSETFQSVRINDVPGIIERATGRRPSMDSVRRWIREGYRGVKLRISGTIQFRHTRSEWIQEFLDACGTAVTRSTERAISFQTECESAEAARKILIERFGMKPRKESA